MKKKETAVHLADFPEELQDYLRASKIYDSSSRSGAKVLYSDKGYYLKIDDCGKLAQEATVARWFWQKGIGVKVVHYLTADRDYLLTEEAIGQDATHFLGNPEKLCQIMAETLHMLHGLVPSRFPRQNRLADYHETAMKNYQKGSFYDRALLPQFGLTSREQAYQYICDNSHLLQEDTFIHGDFCLPNLILKGDYQFSTLIDFDSAGWVIIILTSFGESGP